MSYNPLNPNGQATMANSQPVVLASNQSGVPVTSATFATAAKQDTIIGHVDGIETVLGTIDTDTGGIATSAASIDTKTPALGQALAAASVPVVLTAAQITTLTPPAAINGNTILSAGGSAASSGNNTLIAADATKKIKVAAFSLSTTSTTAMTCIFQDGASGTELWRVIIQAPTNVSSGANLAVPVPSYIFSTTANTLLNLNLSSANAVHWSISYFLETT